jgi:hypothetical protein
MIYHWLAHKMAERNIRLIRLGRKYRWWFLAFWVSLAAFAMTDSTALGIITFILLICAAAARIHANRQALSDLEKIIEENKRPDA